ncbi:MAG: CotH kinase family protein [Deltaproteobacteria bacterium]|nr:CotH kinase family protein [Deltaproteobacteria bacterium]
MKENRSPTWTMLMMVAPLLACTGYDVEPESEFDERDGSSATGGDDEQEKGGGGANSGNRGGSGAQSDPETDAGTASDASDRVDSAAVPVDELPWPSSLSELPSCAPWGDFEMPEIEPPQGDIFLNLSAPLQPVDVDERIEIEVRAAGTTAVDTAVSGAFSLDPGPEAIVVEQSELAGGRGEAVVRFQRPGLYTLHASIAGDERTGTAEVTAYRSQLPLWSMEIKEIDLDKLLVNTWQRVTVPALITIQGETYETEVRIHGGSSRGYDKLSFRFDLGPDLVLPDTTDHIILRGEWNDKTMLRNYLSLELFRNATWVPASNAEIVHFRINQRYYGVLWHVERIGGDFLRLRGMNNETGAMYEADPPLDCWNPGGGLVPLDSLETYQCVYDQKKGEIEYDDLIELIEKTLQLPDSQFAEVIDQEVNVDEYLAYMAVMGVIQNQDHVKKNYYLYRDPEARDKRWIVIPWDLELTFGHLWTEENDVLDEGIFANEPAIVGLCPGFCNQLTSRIYEIPKYQQRFYEFIDHIVENSFTEEFVDQRIDNVICRATPDILADPHKRAHDDEYLDRVDEIREFVVKRRAYLQGR